MDFVDLMLWISISYRPKCCGPQHLGACTKSTCLNIETVDFDFYAGGFRDTRGMQRGFVSGPIFLPVCWCSCTQVRKHQRQEVDSLYFIIERRFFLGYI